MRRVSNGTQTTLAVVTCHNLARYLGQCLMSCVSQTLPFDKIILLDDASTDHTPEVAKRFPQVEYRKLEFRNKHKTRESVYEEIRNFDFVLFVDADNWMRDNYHETLRAGFTSNKVAVAFSDLRMVDENGTQKGYQGKQYLSRENSRLGSMHDLCSLVRSDVFLMNDGFKAEKDFQLEDWQLWTRIRQSGRLFVHCPDTFLNYRVRHERLEHKKKNIIHMMTNAHWKSAHFTVIRLVRGRRDSLATLGTMEHPPNCFTILVADKSLRGDKVLEEMTQRMGRAGLDYAIIYPKLGLCDCSEMRNMDLRRFNEHISKLYLAAATMVPPRTDYVMTWEDDILPFQKNTFKKLLFNLFNYKLAACAPAIPIRHCPSKISAWRAPREPYEDKIGLFQVNYITLSLTLFRMNAWNNIAWRPSVDYDGPLKSWYANDLAASLDARKERPLAIDGELQCGHFDDGELLKLERNKA